MAPVSDTSAFLAALRLLRQGAWTNDPADVGYSKHWNYLDLEPGEQVVQVIPAIAQRQTGTFHPRQPVNLRVTDRDNVYVDTPRIVSVGPAAHAAASLRRVQGMTEPMSIHHIEPVSHQPLTAHGSHADWTVQPRPDAYVGQPADLPARDQLRQAWRFLRGT
jgi:hypothetical protein